MTDIVEQINDRLEAIMDSNNLSVFRAAKEEITTLRKDLAEARALLTVIGKTFAGMEDGDGNEAPELVLIREFTAKSMDDILAKQAARPVLRPPSKAKGEKK